MDSYKRRKPYSLKTVFILSISTCLIGIIGGWVIGRALLQYQIENINNTIPSEYLEGKSKPSQTKAINSSNSNDVKPFDQTNEKMYERDIKEHEGNNIILEDGETLILVPGKLALSIRETSNFFKNVTVQFGSQSKSLYQAEPMSVESDGKIYTIIPINVSMDRVTFSLDVMGL